MACLTHSSVAKRAESESAYVPSTEPTNNAESYPTADSDSELT